MVLTPLWVDNSFEASVINCRSLKRCKMSANVGDVSSDWMLVVFPFNWPMAFSVEIVPERWGEHSDGPYSLKCGNIARQCSDAAEKINSAVVYAPQVRKYPLLSFIFDVLGRACKLSFLTQGICATNEKSRFLLKPLIECVLVCQSLFYERVLLDDRLQWCKGIPATFRVNTLLAVSGRWSKKFIRTRSWAVKGTVFPCLKHVSLSRRRWLMVATMAPLQSLYVVSS